MKRDPATLIAGSIVAGPRVVRAKWDGRELALGMADMPVLVVYGNRTPAKSRAETAALGDLSHAQVK